MSDEFDRVQSLQDKATVQHKPAEFQEAPGEAEANTERDAFLQRAGNSTASQAAALTQADGGLRAQAVSRLQQERGNAYVQRVVAETKGTPGRLVGMSQPEMVDEVLQRKGLGQPLPGDAQSRMESHFGADLSGVRVHADGEAKALNSELDAQAFTVGSDIFFAEGKYNPTSSEGQGLLAHELTHVGQQTGFGAQAVQRQSNPEEEEVQRQASPEEEETPQASAQTPAEKKPEEEKMQ